MVMQERLFFRNIPLSNWIEHEMVVEEGLDLDQLPKESVFAAVGPAESRRPVAVGETRTPISIADGRLPAPVNTPASEGRLPISKLVNETGAAAPAKPQREKTSLIPAHVVAFGAQ